MKKFRCLVTRTDEYEIEIDDKELDQKWLENFRKCFYDFDTYEEHAEHIAQFRTRFGDRFIEGYGHPYTNHEKPIFEDEKSITKDININVISEDEDIEVDTEEIR